VRLPVSYTNSDQGPAPAGAQPAVTAVGSTQGTLDGRPSDPNPSTSSKPSAAVSASAVAGGAVCAAVVCALVLAAAALVMRRRRTAASGADIEAGSWAPMKDGKPACMPLVRSP